MKLTLPKPGDIWGGNPADSFLIGKIAGGFIGYKHIENIREWPRFEKVEKYIYGWMVRNEWKRRTK